MFVCKILYICKTRTVFITIIDGNTYSYWTVTIPAGTISYCLSQWIDTEWYENSNPYDIDITTNEIVNYLAPHVYWASN